MENKLQLMGSINRWTQPVTKPLGRWISRNSVPLKRMCQLLDHPWGRLFALSVLAFYFYVFMEWLFFITKASFMSAMSFGQRIEIFLTTGLFATSLGLVVPLILAGFGLLVRVSNTNKVLISIAGLIPAIALAALMLLMIDNFTYTIFGIGIVSTRGFWRGAYALLFLGLFSVAYNWVYRYLGLRGRAKNQAPIVQFLLAFSLVTISIILALTRISEHHNLSRDTSNLGRLGRRPNIVLLGSDGLDADNMSLYEYGRDTTPRIRQLAETALVAENAFPNTAYSAGSVTSIMTGKLPTQTRVLFPPNILTGIDSYQHLPGILRREGYRTVEIGHPYYVDAYTTNFQEGFDVVNQRSIHEGAIFRLGRRFGSGNAAYFMSRLAERIFDRLLHIFYIKEMGNPYSVVTEPAAVMDDGERIDQLLSLFEDAQHPLFVHVHLMETHGEKFDPRRQEFSAGKTQDEAWMTDFYDDAILDFDTYVGEVVDHLSKTGVLDNTVLVIYTDHGMRHKTNVRIPLAIRFPNGEHAGRIHNNVQNLDITPTILDYLGLPQPDWLDGQSLLRGEPPAQRRIISAHPHSAKRLDDGRCVLEMDRMKPPFYQFVHIWVVICQKWYRLDLVRSEWVYGEIHGHTAPCEKRTMPTFEQIQAEVLDHLAANGFDTTSLQQTLSIQKVPLVP